MRQSVDLDLATYENPFEKLGELATVLKNKGYTAELVTPDADDPLGGLIGEALAELPGDSKHLQVVSAELLVILKLFAGDCQSLSDIRKLLQANPNINRDRVKELAIRAGLEPAWQAIQA